MRTASLFFKPRRLVGSTLRHRKSVSKDSRVFSLPRRPREDGYRAPSSRPVRLSDLRKPKQSEEVASKVRERQPSDASNREGKDPPESSYDEIQESAVPSSEPSRITFEQGRAIVEEAERQFLEKQKKERKRRWNDPEAQYERAKNSAAWTVMRRPHSRHELREKLLKKNHAPEVVEKTLDRFVELELQDDASFAEMFARSKWRQSLWAPSRIRLELQRKGVGSEDVDAALAEVFGRSDGSIAPSTDEFQPEEDDNDSETDPSADQVLLETAKRRLNLMATLPKQTQKRRLVGWLQRRGHSWSTISDILAETGLSSSW